MCHLSSCVCVCLSVQSMFECINVYVLMETWLNWASYTNGFFMLINSYVTSCFFSHLPIQYATNQTHSLYKIPRVTSSSPSLANEQVYCNWPEHTPLLCVIKIWQLIYLYWWMHEDRKQICLHSLTKHHLDSVPFNHFSMNKVFCVLFVD